MIRLQEMLSAQNEIHCYEINYIRIKSYRNRTLQGAFYNPYLQKIALFRSELELLKLLSIWMDERDIPQSTTQLRRFNKKTIGERARGGSAMKHSTQQPCEIFKKEENWNVQDTTENGATFIVQITMRQNSTWQGQVQRTDTNQVCSFQSTLELLLLLTSALDDSMSSTWADSQ
ncbi:MAG: hypothetical protein E7L17_09360 [Clostridium sp.]|uniref:hypothetical protein n=1 Tax=Clostridium sp. TaxID=1506 RepID=UPI0029072E9F|nr:hypothetical protein [Clostridium sp.]MDU7338310.1 hypothetical protein [Clostridium sp.]